MLPGSTQKNTPIWLLNPWGTCTAGTELRTPRLLLTCHGVSMSFRCQHVGRHFKCVCVCVILACALHHVLVVLVKALICALTRSSVRPENCCCPPSLPPAWLCLLCETNQLFSLSVSLSPPFLEFFAELSAAVCPLALNSSMTELVHYSRQGLQWLRLETNTP